MKCIYCGAENTADAVKCRKCMAALPVKDEQKVTVKKKPVKKKEK